MATLTAIFNAQDNLSKAMANAGNAGSKTSGIMQKLGKIGSVAMKGIVTAVTAAGTALLALGKKAVSVGMNFETSMSQVMATMGVDRSTAEGQAAYDKLSAAAEKMGAETAFTASEAADALNYLALAGYDADKAVEALPTVLHLAGAGGMDLATASDMITDSMAALQMEVNQTNLDKFADQMAKTASTTNTSVQQLGEATLAVGATAANLRNGTTELNTQLGILANVGIKGAEGGTHLRNILLRLQNPTDKAAKQLKKLGVSVYDTDGKMRDTGAIFEDLKNSMAGMSQAEIDEVMSTIFNKTDIAAANALLAASGDEYNRIFSIIENSGGAAAEMYKTMLDNLKGDVDIFNSATEALYLSLYKSINGTLRNLVQTGTSYMTRLNDAFNEGGFEGLVTELGNVLGDATGVIMSYAPKIVEAGTGIIVAFVESLGNNADTVAQAAVDVAMALGTAIIKIAPKLATAFVKMIGAAGKALIGAIPDIFRAVPDSVYNALGLDKSKVMSNVQRFARNMKAAISKMFKGNLFGAVDSIGTALNLDEGQISKIKNIITQLAAAFEKVKSAVISVAKSVGQFIGKFAKIGGIEATVAGLAAGFAAFKVISVGKNLISLAKGAKKAGGAMKILGKALAANKFLLIAAAIAAVVAGIILLVKNWDKVKAALKGGIDKVFGAGTFDKISNSLGKVGEKFKKLGGWAKDSWNKMTSAFSEGYKNGGLAGGIKAALGSLKETFSSINWGELGSAAWEKVKSGFSATGDWIKQKVLGDSYTPDSTWGDVGSKIWETIKGGISATGDWIKQKVLGDSYTPDSTWSDVGSKIWETIKGGITATGDWLKTKLGYTPSDSWSTIGTDIWNKIKNGISATGDWLKTKLGYSPSDSWSSIGKSLWEKIKSGISATGDWLKTKLGYSPSDSWSSIGKSLWEKIKSGISATGDWLKTKLGYSPSDSWSSIGKSIWEKIKSGISATGDWLKTKLGYSPSDSWSTIGKTIWEKIKSGISATGDWLKELILGESYTADATWGTVGSAIWEQIWAGITDTGEILKQKLSDVLGKIPGFINELLGGGEAGAAGEGILTNIGEAFKTSFDNLTSYFEPVKAALEELWTKLQGVFQKLGPAIQVLGQAFLAIAKVVGTVVGAIVTWVVGCVNGIINAVGPVVQYIVAGFGVILDVVSAVLSAITGDFSGAWESLKSAFQGVWTMVQNLWAAISGFFTGIWNVAKGVVDAILGAFSGIGATISGIWTGIVNGLINALNWCIDRINDLTGGLSSIWTWTGLEGIGEIQHIDPVEVPVTYVPQNTADSTGTDASPVEVPVTPVFDASSYGDQIAAATDAVSTSLAGTTLEFPEPDTSGFETASQAVEETKTAIEGMSGLEMPDLSGSTSDITDLQSSIEAATSGFGDLESEIGSVGDALAGLDLGAAGGEAGAGYMEGLAGTDPSGAAGTVVTNTENAVRAAQQSGSPAAAFMPMGAEAAQGYGQGLQQEDVSGFANAFASAAMAAVSTATQTEAAALTLEAEGQTVVQTFATGMTAGSPTAVAVMTVLGVAIRAVAQSVVLTSQGLNMLRTLTNGMNSGRGAAVSSARTTGSNIRSAFASINLYSTGANVMRGMLNGMNSMFSTLMARAREMASQLKKTIQSGMQVASPSKFTTWVGEMTGQGLINGIESMTAKAANAASNMVSGVSDAFAPEASASPITPTASPYEALSNGNSSDFSNSTRERHIVIDVKGGGRIEVSGMTKEQAIDLISEQLKPQLQNILANEIFEGGNGVYEF